MQKYPEDILIRRFRGIALLRLGRKKEAVDALEEALKLDPSNVATHFYLAQAYLEVEKVEESRKEYQWVIVHDKAGYRARAQRGIFETLGRGKMQAPKPLNISVIGGYEYDTNATYKSRDKEFSSAGDKNSGRYPTTLVASYRFYQKKKWTFTGDVLYSQMLYDDFTTLQTFTSGAGVSALYLFNLLKKPAFFNIRDGATHTILKNDYYVWSNTLLPSLIILPKNRIRSMISYRFNFNEYANNGTSPDMTSRDGFGHTITLSNTFYFNDKRNFYSTASYDYERNNTHGVSYIKDAHGGLFVLHAPILEKIEGDLSFRFKDSNYPKYSFGPPGRRDDQYLTSVTLSRPITSYLTLSLTYVFDSTDAKNNLYEYKKHVFGVQANVHY